MSLELLLCQQEKKADGDKSKTHNSSLKRPSLIKLRMQTEHHSYEPSNKIGIHKSIYQYKYKNKYINGEEEKVFLMDFQLRNLEESNKYRRNDGIRKSAFSNYHGNNN